MIGIYSIKNIVTNKYYIGFSINIKQRWKQHLNNLKNHIHCNEKLQNAWDKYGQDAFIFQVEEECLYAQCPEREIYYISLYDSFNNGYNLTRGGDKGNSEYFEKPVFVYDLQGNFITDFCSISETSRQLQCNSVKECCNGSCNRGFSKTYQQWFQFKLSYQEKISPFKFNAGLNGKEIYQLDQDGEIINTFSTVADAYRYMNSETNRHNIRDATKTHKPWRGFYWCFVKDYNNEWKPYDDRKIVAIKIDTEQEIGRYRTALEAASDLLLTHSAVAEILKGKRVATKGITFKKIEEN